MRTAWLLLLVGCHRAEDPKHIQSLLARTPLPEARLRKIFEIKPGELEIVRSPAPDLLDDPALPIGELRNVGRRPLWIRRSELEVVVDIDTIVRVEFECVGDPISGLIRPTFQAEEWILLRPGETAPFRMPAPYAWGRAEFWAIVGRGGRSLVRQARSINEGRWAGSPNDWPSSISAELGASWVLPPFSWAEDIRPHALLALTTLDGGRFSWTAELAVDRPAPLPLEAWVLTEKRALVYQGPLAVDAHREDCRRVTTDYRLPKTLPPGDYRILVTANKAVEYLTRDDARSHERYGDGISRWIRFRV